MCVCVCVYPATVCVFISCHQAWSSNISLWVMAQSTFPLKKGRHPVTTVAVSLKRSPSHRSNVQTHKCKCRFPTIQFESDELRLSTESVNQDWSTWSVFKPWQPTRSFPTCDVLSRIDIDVSSAEFYGSTLFLSGSFPHTFGKGMKWFLMLPS